MLYSLSKSFTSSAIGMAVDEGRLSVDDKVISFFPDHLPPQISDNLAAMRIHHLLSMNTGHADEPNANTRQENYEWIKTFLHHPVEYPPGTHFVYNSAATYMLSAIIQKLTGMMLVDYLKPRLFEPLGIENPTWEISPEYINAGGWGLKIRTEDIAVFGQMYLQKGIWQGKRLLSEAWIEQATSRQTDNGSDPNNDWNQGYGYQFWRCRHNAYRGDGAFGQFCIVMPEQDTVVAITSGVADMGAVMNLAWDCLLPAMSAAPFPENAVVLDALRHKTSSLALQPPSGVATSPTAARVSGKTFKAEANDLNVETVSFDFTWASFTITAQANGRKRSLTSGYGEWIPGEGMLFDDLPIPPPQARPGDHDPFVASGVWVDDATFQLTMRFHETPYCTTYTFRFSDDQVAVEANINVFFRPLSFSFTARLT
jgi:CubicO group peptidase (beta-lactamase class C family)